MVVIRAMREDRVIAVRESPRLRCEKMENPVAKPKDDYLFVEDLEVKRLAARYRLTQGQVRGLIAQFGTNPTKLDAEAERLRRY